MRLVSLLLAMVLVVVMSGAASASSRDCCYKVERVTCCEPKPKCCEPVAAKCCEPKVKCCKKRVKVCETVTKTKCDRCGNEYEVTRTRVRHEWVQVDPKSSTPKLTPTPVPVPAA